MDRGQVCVFFQIMIESALTLFFGILLTVYRQQPVGHYPIHHAESGD